MHLFKLLNTKEIFSKNVLTKIYANDILETELALDAIEC